MSFSKDRLQRAYNAPAKQQNKIQTNKSKSVDLRKKKQQIKSQNKPAKTLSRSERASRAKLRKRRQLAERMAQLRDTRFEVEQLSAKGSANVYSVAFKQADYNSPKE